MAGRLFKVLILGLIGGQTAIASGLHVEIIPKGINEAGAIAMTQLALSQPKVQRRLYGSRTHLISSQFQDDGSYLLRIYDYSHDTLLWVSGHPVPGQAIHVQNIEETFDEPLPSEEEFAEAKAIIAQDPVFGPQLKLGQLTPYHAMPGILDTRFDQSKKTERIIAVGLRPENPSLKHEIVGINLSHPAVIHYPKGAPPHTIVSAEYCGVRDAGQPDTARGTPGSAELVVKRGEEVLWRMLVTRPAASSGFWGSGIDLKNVSYRGNLILSHINVPILNVNYDNNVCGPYRDWQYSESAFQADGDDIASGIRSTVTVPQTILESQTDYGNFHGVAVYTEGSETILVSEMSAGWYRYISSFRFDEDGTIRPRFGFSGIYNSCTCNPHHHHAYWRMNFDIGTADHNSVDAFDGHQWNTVKTEARHYRDQSHTKWRVYNTATQHGYVIEPGDNSEPANSFGKGDAWILRYHDGEMDDSQDYVGLTANLGDFVNGEKVENSDVVFWYAEHFMHDHMSDSGSHVIGPTLRPF